MTDEILFRVENRIGWITLNRPAALNALSFDMVRLMDAQLHAWERDDHIRAVVINGAGERAFCAGGDVRAVRASALAKTDMHRKFFEIEYALDHHIWTYAKPIVALMHGIVMGGGMGIAQGAKLRVITDSTRVAMPETAIGFFPDVGGGYFLSRAPGQLGVYLGLTGRHIQATDVMYCGLADVYSPAAAFAELEARLLEFAWSVDAASQLDSLIRSAGSVQLPEAPLAARRAAIDRHFRFDSIKEILASLKSETQAADKGWAEDVASDLAKRSPLMLNVVLSQLRRAKSMPLADCFRMELDMVNHCLDRGDFIEGVRSVLVDKDHAPNWNPPTLEEVDAALVDSFLAPRWTHERHPLASLADC